MLIECESEVGELLLNGESITVAFSDGASDTDSVHSLEAVVRWATVSSIGVQFQSTLSPVVWQALKTHAGTDDKPQTPCEINEITEAQQTAVVASVVDALGRWSQKVFDQLLDELNSSLLQAASVAKSNHEQNAFFDAMSIFRKNGAEFRERMEQTLRRQASQPVMSDKRVGVESEEGHLELVDEDEFEDWLLVSGTASRLEGCFSETLPLVREGLSMVYGLPLDKDDSPVSPAYLARVFEEATEPAYTSEAVHHIVFSEFEKFSRDSLGDVLKSVGEKLDENRVTVLVKQRARARQKKIRNDSPVSVAASVQGGAPDSGMDRGRVSDKDIPAAKDQTANSSAVASGEVAADLRTLEALYNLFTAKPASQKVPEGATPASLDELLAQLNALQVKIRESDSAESAVGDWLLCQLEQKTGQPRYLQPEHRLPVDLADSIFETISGHNRVRPEARSWLERLRVPLIKTVLRDPVFMEDSEHPARQVVNQMVRLSSINSPGGEGLQNTLDAHAKRIEREYEENPDVFREVATYLNKLVERQHNAFLRNFQRVQSARQGQEKLHRARARVGNEIRLHTGSRPVPLIYKLLIECGWRDMLVLTLLREGENSEQWCKYTADMDLLLQWLLPSENAAMDARDGSPDPATIENIVAVLREGFSESGADTVETRRLFAILPTLLYRGSGGKDFDAPGVDAKSFDAEGFDESPQHWLQLESIDSALLKPRPPSEEEPGFVDGPKQALDTLWKRKAGHLEPKDSVLRAPDTANEQKLILAWRSEDGSRLVFVNEQGREEIKYTLNGIAAELYNRQLIVLPKEEMPVVDRGVFSMIQHVYEELAHNAAHDEVTSLYNRREFERLLEESITSTKQASTKQVSDKNASARKKSANQENRVHVLCYLDLDQFKVINSNLGPKVGDQLLREIGELLKSHLPENTILARLGGDEFGILFRDRTIKDAEQQAEKLRDAIKSCPFHWEGEQHRLTVSGGLVEINPLSEDINSLLKAADHTCYAAKDAGRDRLHIYTESDHAISHKRSIMEWISRIGQALEKGEFRLRAQKIAPLDPKNKHQHNEVLLSVVQEGHTCPVPAELIHAAEAYGHMQAIDRWVVHSALEWMSHNPGKIECIGGLSINLSGKSLNDDTFLHFVIQEIVSSGVSPELVCFEITETAAISNLDAAAGFMEEIKRIGCSFALDDFGVGMSSYAYLKNLPVDFLKIDGAFVRDIASSPDDLAMVKSINEIGHFLGKKTIAEFAEDEEIIAILREIGVDYVQGYGIEKPWYLDELKPEW